MEVFFNELSVRPASSDTEARQWLETLADVARTLQQAIESLSENGFRIRVSEAFNILPVFGTEPMIAFLQNQFGYSDPVFVFLLGILDAPYISPDDPELVDYENTSVNFSGSTYGVTGLAAAHLKDSSSVSFDNDAVWNTCELEVTINSLDASARVVSKTATIQHASRKQHIVDCHLNRLASIFN